MLLFKNKTNICNKSDWGFNLNCDKLKIIKIRHSMQMTLKMQISSKISLDNKIQ